MQPDTDLKTCTRTKSLATCKGCRLFVEKDKKKKCCKKFKEGKRCKKCPKR